MLDSRMGSLSLSSHLLLHPARHSAVCDTLLNGAAIQYYGVGNIIFRTCFLAGPVTQFKNMTASKRIVISCIYILSTIGTLLFAIILPDIAILTICCMIISLVSYFFYWLSYVPFGQRLLKKACACCLTSDW